MPDLKVNPKFTTPNLSDLKPNQLLQTKLNMPAVLAKTLTRPRLLERLELTQERKITLICAPAGFGKTTLAVDWLKTLSLPCSWWILDQQDNDRNQFILYLLAALKKLNPEIGKSLEWNSIRNQDIFNIMTILLNDISGIADKSVLVLENFHFITLPEIQQFMNSFIDFLPPQFHLVILTRDDRTLSLGRLRIQNQVAEMRADDLRFTLDEIEQLMSMNFQKPFSALQLCEIESKTSGWAAALRMVMIYLKSQPLDSFTLQGFNSQCWYVGDFIEQEIWNELKVDFQQFLLACSVLDQLSPDLCRAVSGKADSLHYLSELHRNDLFIYSMDAHRYWYQIQPLFMDFLRRKLDPCQEAEYHQLASEWFEKNSYFTEALKHTMHAGDLEQTIKMVNKYSISLLEFGRVSEKMEHFNLLTKREISERPWLCITYAWVLLLNGFLDRADELLAYAAMIVQETDVCQTNPSLYPQLLFLQAYRNYISSDYRKSAQLLLDAEALLHSPSRSIKSLFARLSGLIDLRTGHFESASHKFKNGFHNVSILDDFAGMAVLSYYLLLVKFNQGDFSGVERSLRRLIHYPQPNDIKQTNHVFLPGHAYTKLGFIHWELDQSESARRFVFQGLQHSEQNGTKYDQIITLLDAIHVFGLLGENIMVNSLLEEAVHLSQDFSQHLLYLVHLAQVRHALSLGEIHKASKLINEAISLKLDCEQSSYERIFEGLIRAEVMIAQREYLLAEDLLEEIQIISREHGAKYEEFKILLLLTESAYLKGNKENAYQYLECAVMIGFENGYIKSYFLQSHIAELMSAIIDRVPESIKNYLLKVLAVVKKPSTEIVGQTAGKKIQDALSDREQEIFEFIHAGWSNQEISEYLNITLGTTKWHIVNIFSKLGVHSRTQAVQKGYELGILKNGAIQKPT